MTFIENLTNAFSAASAAINNARAQGMQIIQSFQVPQPAGNDPYVLNRYINDLREQSPAYQQTLLQKIEQEKNLNLIMAAAAGAIVVALLVKK